MKKTQYWALLIQCLVSRYQCIEENPTYLVTKWPSRWNIIILVACTEALVTLA